jgi:hypothetical protein
MLHLYGTRRFITAFPRAHHLTPSWASLINSTPSYSKASVFNSYCPILSIMLIVFFISVSKSCRKSVGPLDGAYNALKPRKLRTDEININGATRFSFEWKKLVSEKCIKSSGREDRWRGRPRIMPDISKYNAAKVLGDRSITGLPLA